MFVDFNILNQLGSPSINSNTFANRPAAGQTGRLFVSTDTYEIYRDNGTTWDLIGGPGSSTVTGTGAATQVAYWTAAQAIGGSNNLWWDNTNGFLGVGTAAPTTRIEAVKTDGIGIYANFTTNAGSGSGTTGIYSINNTASSGYAAVIEERTANTTGGQYPLLVKHSLSAGTAAVGMGTGLQFQLPDDAGTFKTTQLTIETIDAAAATYKTRYRFNVQNNGSSTPVAYINSTGVGVFTATPSAALDIHSTGVIAVLNSTGSTNNGYLAFQRAGAGVWRIGDSYNGGANFFELHNTVLTTDALQVAAATNKTSWQATETYTTGLARGNYFDFNLSVAAGGSFSSPNAITALGATLDLTLAGNATIPSGARSGLDAYNTISFTGAGTLTHNQGTQIRAYSNVTAGWAFGGSATGTITHLAGLRALFPDNSGSAVNITNNYALLLNDQTANTGTVTYTNRWGVYQEGASDLNYFAANTLIGSTTNTGDKLQVTGTSIFTSGGNSIKLNGNDIQYTRAGINYISCTDSIGSLQILTGGVNLGFAQNLNGNVGISTSTANYKLTVNSSTSGFTSIAAIGNSDTGNSTTTLLLQNTSSTESSGTGVNLNFSGASNWLGRINAVFTGTTGSGNADLSFWTPTNGTLSEKMRITAAGLVGIGTNAPSRTLTVYNTAAQDCVLVESTQVFSTIAFKSSTNTSTATIGIDGAGNAAFENKLTTGAISFVTNTTERARIVAGGNFLIGTTTDAGYKLQVNGTGNFVGDIRATVDLYLSRTGVSPAIVLDQSQIRIVDQSAGVQNSLDNISGAIQFSNGIKTSAPTTGTAAIWKLGSRVAATVVVNTTEYIEIDIGGTLYKLATVT